MKIIYKDQKGHGLVETVITLLIIAGAVAALIQFQNHLAYNNSIVQQQGEAVSLAMNRIEILKDFSTLTGSNSYQSIASGSATANGANTTYTITWAITTNTNPNYKTANVTVSWTDRRGSTQSIQLTTRIAGIDPAFSAAII